jgi:hypothetical protein
MKHISYVFVFALAVTAVDCCFAADVAETGTSVSCTVTKQLPDKNAANYKQLHRIAVAQAEAETSLAMCEYVAAKDKKLQLRFPDKELLSEIIKHSGISGHIKGKRFETQTIDNTVVTVAACPVKNITAALKDIDPFSPKLVVVIARYYQKNGKEKECVAHCQEWLPAYRNLKDKDFFVPIGDVLAEFTDNKEAEKLALSAYDEVERLIMNKEQTILNPLTNENQ